MRITVTLERDVAKALLREMFRSGASLKVVANYFLRMGFRVSDKNSSRQFVVHPKPLGLPIGCGHECVEELLENLDSSPHK